MSSFVHPFNLPLFLNILWKRVFIYACTSRLKEGLGTIGDKISRPTTLNGRKGIATSQNPPPPTPSPPTHTHTPIVHWDTPSIQLMLEITFTAVTITMSVGVTHATCKFSGPQYLHGDQCRIAFTRSTFLSPRRKIKSSLGDVYFHLRSKQFVQHDSSSYSRLWLGVDRWHNTH